MELGKLETRTAHEAGAEMRVIGPDGDLTDLYLTILGVDSTLWRGLVKDIERKVAESVSMGEDPEINKAEYIAQAVIDWRGAEENGEKLPFSQDRIKRLFDDAPYICDQADRFMSKRINFTGGNSQG
jgi:hypothetical protein